MIEEAEGEADQLTPDLPTSARAAALGLAIAAASRKKADLFLDEQTAITRLQREHLHEQRELQISHLRWRRFNDWMRAGWQTILGAAGVEMWGEALMLKNRSDLALSKFEEANKYAPNWARLHLKWGEALSFAGRKDDAKKQLAIAAGLDLQPPNLPSSEGLPRVADTTHLGAQG